MTTVIEHVYNPRGTAKQLLTCRVDEVALAGPAGTGKTRACLEKMLYLALLNGGTRRADGRAFKGLIARKVGVALTGTTLPIWREEVAAEAIRTGVCWYYGGSRSEPAQYKFANGSSIALTGLDKPMKIMSAQFDAVYVGESTELDPTDWEFIITRLRNGRVSFQQLFVDCNPDVPTHWLKKRADSGQLRMLHAEHWENPRYYEAVETGAAPIPATVDCPEREVVVREGVTYRMTVAGAQYIVGKLRKLTGVRKQRLHDGLWVAAEGIIYESWNPAIHLVDRFVIPQDWPRFWSIDFGYTNPFVCQFWAVDPDGRAYLYREIYRTKRLVEDHARDILRTVTKAKKGLSPAAHKVFMEDRCKALAEDLVDWNEPQPVKVICDHDAEDRATLKRYLQRGTTAARKEVKNGLEAVEKRLRVAGDGRPRLHIMRSAVVKRDPELDGAGLPTCTEEEIGGYVWEPPKPGERPKETPRKEDDHGCDAMRYFVADRDLGMRIRDRDHLLEG